MTPASGRQARFDVDSAGTDRTAAVHLEEWHLEWADAILGSPNFPVEVG